MGNPYKYSHDENGKERFALRDFPHSKARKAAEDRYRSDREEAMEYTSSFSTLRQGRDNGPDIYDDVPVCQKYPTKPKGRSKKGGKTIRKVSPGSPQDTEERPKENDNE